MKAKILLLSLLVVILAVFGCTKKHDTSNELVIYSPNVDTIINTIIPLFEEETGIKVTVISAGAGEVGKRIASEKNNPYADIHFGGFVSDPELYEVYKAKWVENLVINQEKRPPFATP